MAGNLTEYLLAIRVLLFGSWQLAVVSGQLLHNAIVLRRSLAGN
jgi:hypothetical protein